ncbi:hypothetical protein [Aeoliella mucimassa]|uniref:Uncharacterized protein n=1 Tax=Aeoliella mucimassa TaxID=2527972 RepID=A0A518AN84_9BACT|nr:hypothetical protein [Aeoliella mucimassa]QDU56192.1 hypothetical protein Pan181_23990 [Aeoliella mucimassa]
MNYGSKHLDYALRNCMIDEVETGDNYHCGTQIQYKRKRSVHALRRRRRRKSDTPGCGIGGRNNRRYSW